ncbi:MAG: thioredoxin family protein [Elusimicrobiota bacterium]
MSLVHSVEIPLGREMPDFELEDVEGKVHKGRELYGEKGLLVAFTCNHCPYAIAIWPRLIRLAERARGLGVAAVAINPNINPDYPEDAPGKMREKIREWGISFPYIVDAEQRTARSFGAQCTPDLYLFDASRRLSYHGRFDDDWQDETRVKRRDLESAVEALAAGRPVSAEQLPSMGCSIKWRG